MSSLKYTVQKLWFTGSAAEDQAEEYDEKRGHSGAQQSGFLEDWDPLWCLPGTHTFSHTHSVSLGCQNQTLGFSQD